MSNKIAIAAILADTHLKEENIEINKSIYRQATAIAKEHGLNCIDHAGDIFNSRKAQSEVVLLAFKEILDELWNEGMQLNSTVGNHDKTSYDSADSFLDPFSKHPALNLHPYGGWRTTGDEDIIIHYAAYLSDDQYIHQIEYILQNQFQEGKENVLITHIGVSGAVMNNGTVIDSEKITPNIFKNFSNVLIGHYHDAQTLAEGRIRYCGAALQHNFGEMTGKGLTILYDDLSVEIIPLQYPQFIKYEVATKDLTSKDIAEIKQEVESTGDNIRIVLTGSDADIKSFNKQLLMEAGVSVQNKADDITVEQIEQRVEAFDTVSLLKEFEVFCLKNNLDLAKGMKYFNCIIDQPVIAQVSTPKLAVA